MMFPIGPKEKWEHDVSKMCRAALVVLVTDMQWRLALYDQYFNTEKMVSMIALAKKYGRWDNAEARHAKFMADPDKAIKQTMRRRKAAKRASRQSKRRASNAR
jgi:hypothetical protein